MTREEELYWLNQPEWVVNAEMERRIRVYLESPKFKKRLKHRLDLDKRSIREKEKRFDSSIEQLKKAI